MFARVAEGTKTGPSNPSAEAEPRVAHHRGSAGPNQPDGSVQQGREHNLLCQIAQVK